MIYAWTIKENSDLTSIPIAAGCISAKDGKEAEKFVRSDWKIEIGYFSYTIVKVCPESRHSVILYKERKFRDKD